MNQEKLARLQYMQRIGGKGTPRRTMQKAPTIVVKEDKKLASTLQKLDAQRLNSVEECNMFTKDGKIMHFDKPTVDYVDSSTFAISGKFENKDLMELMPNVLSQLGAGQVESLRLMANS